MQVLEAFPNSNNGELVYHVRKNRETYLYYKKFKQVGATYDGSKWIFTNNQITELQKMKIGIERMILVSYEAHCHEPAGKCWARESEVAEGKKRMGCSMCDTPEICGEYIKIWIEHDNNA